jgi:hypothetical protein
MLNSYGKDVILIAHMSEQRSGDELIERLDVQGGSKEEIYKSADAMGRLHIRDGRRVLNFSPTDVAFGKNPGQLEELEVPPAHKAPNFMAKVISDIKANLNKLTDEQTAAATLQIKWRERISATKDIALFNALLPESKATGDKVIPAMVAAEAKVRGYKYDAGAYHAPVEASA